MHITPSSSDIDFAKNFLIMEAQKIYYPEEYIALSKSEKISDKSQLIKLNPQLRQGVMIMKSRLGNLHTMPEQMKNPIILPMQPSLTRLYFNIIKRQLMQDQS